MEQVVLESTLLQDMFAHILACLPEEACGLLAGQNDRVLYVIPISNRDHSAIRFTMDPHEMVKAFYWMEENKLDLIGVFHSHPTGPAFPSETDIKEYAYPEAAALIWSPGQHEWSCRAYHIANGSWYEIPIKILRNT